MMTDFFYFGGNYPFKGKLWAPQGSYIYQAWGLCAAPFLSIPHPNSPSSGQLMFPPSGAAILHQPEPIAVMVFKHSLIIGLIEVSCVHWVHV